MREKERAECGMDIFFNWKYYDKIRRERQRRENGEIVNGVC